MSFKRSLSSLLLTLLLLTNTFAQATGTPALQPDTPEQKEARKATEKKALALLDEIIKETQTLKLSENRALLLTAAADLYWQHDEQRARLLIKDAIKTLEEMTSATPLAESSDNPGRRYRLASMYSQMRWDILQILARHDPRWAREVLRTTSTLKIGGVDISELSPDGERGLAAELNLASIIAANDPKQALEMAEASLTKGISHQLIEVLAELQQKDTEAAARLAASMVAKLKTEKPDPQAENARVAMRLLQAATTPRTSAAKPEDKTAQPLLSEQSLRELAEIVAAAGLNTVDQLSAYMLTTELEPVMPVLERYAPARVAQLRRKLNERTGEKEETGEYAKYSEAMAELEKMGKDVTPEAIVESASKIPQAGLRNQYYQEAATKMVEKGDEEKARQMITERVQDPRQRARALELLNQQQLRVSAEKGKVEETRRLLASARSDEERVTILVHLAQALAAKGNKEGKDAALKLLDEARGIVGVRAKSMRQMYAQLQLAQAFARIEPSRTLQMLDAMVEQLNELLAAAILLGGFILEDEIITDDEVQMPLIGMILSKSLDQFGTELGALAQADFDGLKRVADKFERPEIRILARLLVVQGVLSDVRTRPRPYGSRYAPDVAPTDEP